MTKVYKDAFQFQIPNFDTNIVNTSFSISSKYGNFLFTLYYRGTGWICYVTLPDTTIRYFGLFPNVVNWKYFTDFGIFIRTNDSVISKTNIQNQTVVVLVWQ